MDARTLYGLLKPHLDLLDHSEKAALSNLISKKSSGKVTHHHRKVLSLSKAKEYLKLSRKLNIEKERAKNRA